MWIQDILTEAFLYAIGTIVGVIIINALLPLDLVLIFVLIVGVINLTLLYYVVIMVNDHENEIGQLKYGLHKVGDPSKKSKLQVRLEKQREREEYEEIKAKVADWEKQHEK